MVGLTSCLATARAEHVNTVLMPVKANLAQRGGAGERGEQLLFVYWQGRGQGCGGGEVLPLYIEHVCGCACVIKSEGGRKRASRPGVYVCVGRGGAGGEGC